MPMERARISLTYVVAVSMIFALAMIILGLATWAELDTFNAYVGIPLVVGLAELPAIAIGTMRKRPRALAMATFALSLTGFVFAIFVPFWPGPEAFLPANEFASRVTSLAFTGTTAVLMVIPLVRRSSLGEPRRDAGYAIPGH